MPSYMSKRNFYRLLKSRQFLLVTIPKIHFHNYALLHIDFLIETKYIKYIR